MDNVKMTVTFVLPGNTMYSEETCAETPSLYDLNKVHVNYKEKGQYKNETISFHTRGCKIAKQTMNMTEEAYRGMLNTPINSSPNHWKRLPEDKRIIEHLKSIQYDLNALSFDFHIYSD